MAITEKRKDNNGISIYNSLMPEYMSIRYPAPAIKIFNVRSNTKYLKTGFKIKWELLYEISYCCINCSENTEK